MWELSCLILTHTESDKLLLQKSRYGNTMFTVLASFAEECHCLATYQVNQLHFDAPATDLPGSVWGHRSLIAKWCHKSHVFAALGPFLAQSISLLNSHVKMALGKTPQPMGGLTHVSISLMFSAPVWLVQLIFQCLVQHVVSHSVAHFSLAQENRQRHLRQNWW